MILPPLCWESRCFHSAFRGNRFTAMHNPFRFDRVGNMAMCVWELKRFAATVGEVGAAAVKSPAVRSVRAAADERTMGNNAKYTT